MPADPKEDDAIPAPNDREGPAGDPAEGKPEPAEPPKDGDGA